ncbi:MAG: FAD-dependent 5-carboxymethylaminomethyl-2-thiouridine(34) oxidoreductase MnmC [Marinobacter sp.]|uniref:FAD-dependent 5-carboxymethylaminomethyl-2-thiouridine(34) oxidoreductase MnmC n=1 Tax=Marinobacter sp. TaxID=50741 RepID=UPI0034A07C74
METPHSQGLVRKGLGGPRVTPVEFDWIKDQPIIRSSGEQYPNSTQEFLEAAEAFIKTNRLQERFRTLTPGQSIVIAEAVFGAGLGFLATWHAWKESSPAAGAVLHFVASTPRPLKGEDLRRMLTRWPHLQPLANELAEHFPALVAGSHRLVFEQGQVRLTLNFSDPVAAWADMGFTADAWFLSATEQDAVTRPLLQTIREHSHSGTTASVIGADNDTLATMAEYGFEAQGLLGAEHGRNMRSGSFGPEAFSGNQTDTQPPSTTIIGAGIAGALLARNLAQRGWPVTVLEGATSPAAGASGNQQGALYVKLGVDYNAQSQLALSALLHSQRFYRQLSFPCWHASGLLQLAWSPEEADRQRRFCERNDYPSDVLRPVGQEEARHLSGAAVPTGGLWYQNSGWLEPARLCEQLLDHPLISLRFGFQVTRLMPCNGRWHVSGLGKAEIATGRVVLCAGHQIPKLLPVFGDFRFKSIRGQVTSLTEETLKAPTAVICGPCYLNPVHQGQCLTGATFDLRDSSPELKVSSHEENLDQLGLIVPQLWTGVRPAPEGLDGRVAFRCTTHDYQPVAGPLTDQSGQVLEGIDLLTGFGSKGLAYAPLLAEYLADYITGQPSALPDSLASRVHPDRCRSPVQQKTA